MEIAPSQLSRCEWDALIGAAPLQQVWNYGVLAEGLGATVRRLELRVDGAIVGLAQVLVRRLPLGSVALLSRGPIWLGDAEPAGIAGLPAALDAPRPRLLLVTPESDPAGMLPLFGAPVMAELDLARDAAQLRAGLHGKWRNRLRRAEGRRTEVEELDHFPAWLAAAEAAQRRRRGYRGMSPGWARGWARLDGARTLTLVALDAGVPIAAMMFLVHGRSATYQVGWIGTEGRSAKAHNLLLWQAMLRLKARGIARLDLGRIDTAPDGLRRFKLGSGAQAVTLGRPGLVLPAFRPGWAARGRSRAGPPALRS